MKILSAKQIRAADQFTIQNEPISSIDLMERASKAFVGYFTEVYSTESPIIILAGKGNNGGDGLAIARLLMEQNYSVKVFSVGSEQEGSEDFKINYQRLSKLTSIQPLDSSFEIEELQDNAILIDALFGTGLTRKVEGYLSEIIQRINKSKCEVVSVDIPSGLFCDEINEANDSIIQASLTLSFQVPKLSFFLPENENFIEKWRVLDINLDNTFLEGLKSDYSYLLSSEISNIYIPRKNFSHKGNFGKTLLIGGSYGKIGAILLTTKACIKSGAGLVTSLIPKCGYVILQTGVPEAMVITSESEREVDSIPLELSDYSNFAIGPGLGTSLKSQEVLLEILESKPEKLVIDADGLNILAQNNWLNKLPENCIITPHIGEFDRLFGKSKNSLERIEKSKKFTLKNKIICILKGANTSIVSNGKVSFNSTGNPGLATGGSGDVLTGIVSSFLGQGYSSVNAAKIGVFQHGLAADLALNKNSFESISASTIINFLGKSFLKTFSALY